MPSSEPSSNQHVRYRIMQALGIEARSTAEMPEALRARVLANVPSAEEIADGQWRDGRTAEK